MAGWGDDPELERLRGLLAGGWEVVEVTEDVNAPGGLADKVTLSKGGESTSCSSDHLAFHRYVQSLGEDPDL